MDWPVHQKKCFNVQVTGDAYSIGIKRLSTKKIDSHIATFYEFSTPDEKNKLFDALKIFEQRKRDTIGHVPQLVLVVFNDESKSRDYLLWNFSKDRTILLFNVVKAAMNESNPVRFLDGVPDISNQSLTDLISTISNGNKWYNMFNRQKTKTGESKSSSGFIKPVPLYDANGNVLPIPEEAPSSSANVLPQKSGDKQPSLLTVVSTPPRDEQKQDVFAIPGPEQNIPPIIKVSSQALPVKQTHDELDIINLDQIIPQQSTEQKQEKPSVHPLSNVKQETPRQYRVHGQSPPTKRRAPADIPQLIESSSSTAHTPKKRVRVFFTVIPGQLNITTFETYLANRDIDIDKIENFDVQCNDSILVVKNASRNLNIMDQFNDYSRIFNTVAFKTAPHVIFAIIEDKEDANTDIHKLKFPPNIVFDGGKVCQTLKFVRGIDNDFMTMTSAFSAAALIFTI